MPAQIADVIPKPQFGLDPLKYRHPIVAPFRGRERAGLLTTPIAVITIGSKCPKTAPVSKLPPRCRRRSLHRDIAARSRPRRARRDGRLALLSRPTTGEPWTNWPTWPSFLPIVRELLSFATGGQHDRWQQLVGTSFWRAKLPPPMRPNSN